MENSFYENVFLLTQVVPPSKEFLKHFKQGMFDKPNTVGFLHMTHYLLNIYDAERFKKQIQWPVFCKKTEAKYRTEVKDLLTAVASENRDVDFPQIHASHLLHAGGNKFSTIMWKLSTVALRTHIKREEPAINLISPKSGVAEELSKTLLNNIINRSTKNIEDLNESMAKMASEAELCAKEMAESLQKNQEELLLARQNLRELAAKSPAHPEMKKRLADPNDTEVIELWKASFAENMEYNLKKKQRKLKEITKYSNNVAAIVSSIASTDSNLLDGSRLSKIDVNAVSEINGLLPEAKIILRRLYANENLVLEKLLLFFNHVLSDFRRILHKHGFPDVSECDAQVSGSCEDMKSISVLFRGLHDRIADLSSEIKNGSNCSYRKNSQNYFSSNSMEDDIFDSILLKSSPSININRNPDIDGTDAHGNIELTPVDDARNKALFARYKRHKDLTPQNHTKLRPKLLVSRINFEEANSSTISIRLSPASRGSNSKLNLSGINKSGKYSRLFASHRRNPSRGLNSTVKSMQGSSRLNSIADISTTSHVYNISELVPHVVTTNKFNNRLMLTPPKRNSERASSTIIEDEKCNSTIEVSHSVINEGREFTTAECCSPKIIKSEKQTDKNRRVSISDLVERYSKIRESTNVTAHFESSSEASDESGKQ